jgi:hypothetical protein
VETKSVILLTVGAVALGMAAWDLIIVPVAESAPASNPLGALAEFGPFSYYTGLSDTWLIIIGVLLIVLSFLDLL